MLKKYSSYKLKVLFSYIGDKYCISLYEESLVCAANILQMCFFENLMNSGFLYLRIYCTLHEEVPRIEVL